MVKVVQKIITKLRAKSIHLHNNFKAQKNKILSKIVLIHIGKEMKSFKNTINKKKQKLLKEIEVQTCQEILQ